MPKIFYCSKCQDEHERPVGKKCQLKSAGESFSSTGEVAASSSTSGIAAVSDQILSKLQQIGQQMELMDRRVQRTEAALEQGSSRVSPLLSVSQGQQGTATVSNHTLTVLDSNGAEANVDQSVVPSIEFLRSNESVQCEVEKRLAELRTLNESATKGRVKSQRGGPGEIFVKKSVDWPQNFILTGNQKTRPTYDDLSITQWVSGFVRCIQEEKAETCRSAMLDYLANLMEDASDFSWDSAKACHAILLTNMEADRVSWVETDKVDRFRRAHAQRHVTGVQTSATRSVSKKPKMVYSKGSMICRYFQEGTCRFPTHHKTAGQFYRHVCENCNGTHTTKNCTQKIPPKN